jgi:hypothetical protein
MKNGSSVIGVALSAAGVVLLGLVFGFSKPIDPALRASIVAARADIVAFEAAPLAVVAQLAPNPTVGN